MSVGSDTGNVASYSQVQQPDGEYRKRPFFKINKKELRGLVRKGSVPKRAKKFGKVFGGNNFYLRYGKRLTFNMKNFMKGE